MATADDAVQFRPASDQSLLVSFEERTLLEAHRRVRALLHLLATEPVAGVRNLHPAYSSVLIDFDALRFGPAELEKVLRRYVSRLNDVRLRDPKEFEIPTCYGGEYGPDLNEVARLHGILPDQAIQLHSSVAYTVYFLGFVPGFAYLGELPEMLRAPRFAAPRRTTLAGSVGIADNQTGVYPFATPGGWRIIGRTPLAIFRPDHENMSLLNVGDIVRFIPISVERFSAWHAE
ncbi:MAG TPA: 5-oxoprolinase subunit PxpB [Candidatus Acidoferrales bacterium]|nr:5-oxoprolinase subunit PxpB [Candidatus Acidoferrales bacterium]